MTKLLRAMIDAENTRRGKKYPDVGALTTWTRGFGQPNDLKIGEIINPGGGVSYRSEATARAFGKYLESLDRREMRCTACRRDEADCSADPCGAVRVDREWTGKGKQ